MSCMACRRLTRTFAGRIATSGNPGSCGWQVGRVSACRLLVIVTWAYQQRIVLLPMYVSLNF